MLRYRPRYRDNTRPDIRVCLDIAFSDIVSPRHVIVTKTRYRVIFPDIGPDIGNIGADIGTISGRTRSLPNPILPISGPISGFFSISATISGQYRDIPVPCQTRYRVFHRYLAQYGPDIAKNIGIYGYRNKKTSMSFPMCMKYRIIPISCTSDIGRFS
jgi:hypothetical protein